MLALAHVRHDGAERWDHADAHVDLDTVHADGRARERRVQRVQRSKVRRQRVQAAGRHDAHPAQPDKTQDKTQVSGTAEG